MKVSEITALLKKNRFIKLNAEDVLNNKIQMTDKSYFKWNGDLHIRVNKNLSYEVVSKKNDIGMGRYIWSDGEGNQTGTYFKELFFPEFIKNIENA